MKAEDIREGMWLRGHDGAIFRIKEQRTADREWYDARWLDGKLGLMHASYAPQAEPWTPRAGDWVRFTDACALARTAWQVHLVDGLVYTGSDGALTFRGGLEYVEPCPPPEAKPSFSGPQGTATLRAVYEGPNGAESIQASGILRDAALPPTRDHNATCPKCGGRAYQGLLNARCVEPVCDDPETREPDDVRRVVDTRRRWGFDANGHEDHRCYVERVYEAVGRGVTVRHPTREGAIQAWREAVRK